MAKYPERHSAALPALEAAQRVHGWCSPEAIHQVAAVMQVTPAYLSSRRDLLRHAAHRAGRAATTSTSAPASPATCANAQALLRGDPGGRRQGSRTRDPRFECLGACDMAPMASIDGRYVGPARPERGAASVIAALGRAASRCPGAGSATRASGCHGRTAPMPETRVLLDAHRRARPAPDRRLRAPRRLPGAAQGAHRDGARRRSSRSSRAPACAAAAAPASRWARRPASCPRARWTSTSAATPTSRSPAPSRTGC